MPRLKKPVIHPSCPVRPMRPPKKKAQNKRVIRYKEHDYLISFVNHQIYLGTHHIDTYPRALRDLVNQRCRDRKGTLCHCAS